MAKETDPITAFWHLISLNGDTIADETVWVRFTTDGRFTGSTGTHSMNGHYRAVAEELEILWLSLIRKGCMIDPSNRFEPAFLSAFKSAKQYVINEGGLRLINNEGRDVLLFKSD